MNVEISKSSRKYKANEGKKVIMKTGNGKQPTLVWTWKNYDALPNCTGGNETFLAAQRVLTAMCYHTGYSILEIDVALSQ